MGKSIQTVGETVRLGFSGSIPSAGTTALLLYDINGVIRALQVYERLVLDGFTVAASLTNNTPDIVYVLNQPGGSVAAVDAAHVLAAAALEANNNSGGPGNNAGSATSFSFAPQEGLNVGIGIIPSLISLYGSDSYNVIISARVVNAGTSVGRPSWRESLNSKPYA